METFWTNANWEMLLDKQHTGIHYILPDIVENLLDKKSDFCLQLDKETLVANLIFDWNYFLLYFEWFGLWICEKDQVKIDYFKKKNSYFAKSLTLTDFGINMLPILMKSRNLLIWNIPLRQEYGEVNPIPGSTLPEENDGLIKTKDQRPQPFHQAFATLFSKSDLNKSLPRMEQNFTNGVHTFKVAFDDIAWRKIVLSAKHTMDDLHKVIIRAFQFDDDHLYSFLWMEGNGPNHALFHQMIGRGNQMQLKR